MSNLGLIRLQAHDFYTSQATDFLQGLPVIGLPGSAGVVAGSANVGKANLVVSAVDVGAEEGVHVVTVTDTAGGLIAFTVTDPDGDVTGRGVAGLPLYAAGLTLALSPIAGQIAPTVGDTFAVAVLPVPLDLTGFVFSLDARLNTRSATVVLSASSAPSDGAQASIVNGGVAGTLAMQVFRPAMMRCAVGDFPYAMLATDPATGLSVPAFVGTLFHRAIPTLQS